MVKTKAVSISIYNRMVMQILDSISLKNKLLNFLKLHEEDYINVLNLLFKYILLDSLTVGILIESKHSPQDFSLNLNWNQKSDYIKILNLLCIRPRPLLLLVFLNPRLVLLVFLNSQFMFAMFDISLSWVMTMGVQFVKLATASLVQANMLSVICTLVKLKCSLLYMVIWYCCRN